jgi:hypothetical protein
MWDEDLLVGGPFVQQIGQLIGRRPIAMHCPAQYPLVSIHWSVQYVTVKIQIRNVSILFSRSYIAMEKVMPFRPEEHPHIALRDYCNDTQVMS